MTSQDVRNFVERLYLPTRMVLYVYGNVPMTTIVREAVKGLRKARERESGAETLSVVRQAPTLYTPRHVEVEKAAHQAHVMMGVRTFAATDPRHLHLYVLNNMLGGPGMNSRLNLSLRERNGLVYNVESASVGYTDTGVWTVYFGCDPHDVVRCKKLVMRELARLTERPLSASVLEAAKRQIMGQAGISYDSFENVAINMGKRFLHYNTTQTYEALCQRVQALTSEELFHTAREVFVPENISTMMFV